MKIISHKFDPKQAKEIVIMEDVHGRRQHLQIHILRDTCPHCHSKYPGGIPDPDEIIQQAIAQLEQDEQTIHHHIEQRFDRLTLERRKF